MGFGFIVAPSNGILFSYLAEGPFHLINMFGLTPSEYGLSFIVIAGSMMLGGIVSHKLQNSHSSRTIMYYGLLIIVLSTVFWSTLVL